MSVKKTITSIFIVPTLGIDKKMLIDNGFINGYSKDGHKDVQYENCIYLVFHPKDLDRFREFLDNEYERTKSIVDDYDYEDGFVVVVYKLSDKYFKDFELVRQSKYSKTSKSFQTLFPKLVNITKNNIDKQEVSLQFRVFNKTEDLIKYWEDLLDVTFEPDQEVWHAFEEEKETFTIQKLKENV